MRGVQPANSPLAYYLSIPQWRCSKGHWNDVSHVMRRCYGCCEQPQPCETCGGDGRFEEMDGTFQCEPCAGWGIQWDWPNDEAPETRVSAKGSDNEIF